MLSGGRIMKKAFVRMRDAMKKMSESLHRFAKKNADGFYLLLKKYDWAIFLGVITILSLVMRYFLFDCVRGDYTSCLKPWYTRIYNGGAKELGVTFGDYTPAYYYILYFISLFRFDPESYQVLHAIKWVSVFFDYLLAVYCSLICYRVTSDKTKTMLCYFLCVFGITIFLNSALWGQCDSIYACFSVMALYYLLKKRPNLAMIFYGCAFSFKLQSIFILPIILVLFLRRKFNLKYLLWVPFIYILFALPASLLADNFIQRFGEILSVYFNQAANSYTQVTLNAGTLYALIFTNFKDESFVSSFAVFLGIAIIGTYCFFIYRSKAEFTPKIWVKIACLLVLVTPYVLPHMHERYFYLADVLVILYALSNPKKFYVAIPAITNSMIGYMVYLWNIPFINVVPQEESDPTKALSLRFGAILYLVAIAIVTADLFKEIYPNGLNPKKERSEVQNGEGI